MDEKVPIEEIEVVLKVAILKLLHASWLMVAYNLTSAAGEDIIANKWKLGGITEVVSEGIEGFENHDLFI